MLEGVTNVQAKVRGRLLRKSSADRMSRGSRGSRLTAEPSVGVSEASVDASQTAPLIEGGVSSSSSAPTRMDDATLKA